LIVGDDEAAMALSRSLEEEGFLAVAIRPPTVPEGMSRLRFALSAAHEEEDLARLAAAVIRLAARESSGAGGKKRVAS
jgi:8-amino-7-oxononanoate synthase